MLRYLFTDGAATRKSFWLCRCHCGRPDCRGLVRWPSWRLSAARWHWCGGKPRGRRVRPAPAAAPDPTPEGLRPPWSRTPDERAGRDARLLAAFDGADLR